MSPIALILNLSLGALLIGAMILGQRLDKRLRALRDSHNSFFKAVSELDHAADRTQAGLNELKAAAEDARNDLAGRINAAHALSDRLSKLLAEADAKTDALSRIQAQIKAPRPILLRTPIEPQPAAAPKAAPTPLQARAAQTPSQPQARPAATARSRAAVDDELFETAPAGLSALAGGRR
ncbi:MAG TPA: DUF6468 domain-containing protein [Caulobacteraceae bacterium]|nr:DUF6468 domain-containing protein [Caulobacteraceae bacterium]